MRYVHFTAPELLSATNPVFVFLIGAGGTGSQVLTGLARLNHALVALGHPGIHVVAFDGDAVSESNVGRQLFSPADVGENKAVSLVSRLNRFFGTEWEAEPFMFETEAVRSPRLRDAVRLCSMVVSCVDSAKARLCIAGSLREIAATSKSVPLRYWLDTGNTKDAGQVVLGTVGSVEQPESSRPTLAALPTILDLFPAIEEADADEDQGPSCSMAEALRRQDLFVNSFCATYACDLLWKMFKDGRIASNGVFFNAATFQSNPLRIDSEVYRRFGWSVEQVCND